jgi:hypothetical protein
VAGQYVGNLSNAGEDIELVDAVGNVIQSFEYTDEWFDLTDGAGFSLTVRDPQITPADGFGSRDAWRPSAFWGGSPGSDDYGLVPEPGIVVINELLANSVGTGPDWIELHNTTDQDIDIGGWYLSDDGDEPTQYRIAAGTILPAGGYLVFYEDEYFGNEADPGCQTPFGLAKDGEKVYLHSGDDDGLTGYSERQEFGASAPGVTFGRCPNDSGGYDFVPLAEPTPGGENAGPLTGSGAVD